MSLGGNYPAALGGMCMAQVFREAEFLGQTIGYRYAHCMAACWLKTRCGLPQVVVQGLGHANEMGQTVQCFATGTNCHSAYASVDLDDNERGYSCPRQTSCEEQCKNIKLTPKKAEGQYGPFYSWGYGFFEGL